MTADSFRILPSHFLYYIFITLFYWNISFSFSHMILLFNKSRYSFFWFDLPLLAVYIIFVLFLPSIGPSYPSSFQVNPGIEPTSEDHGSDCMSSMFPTRLGSFPDNFFVWLDFLTGLISLTKLFVLRGSLINDVTVVGGRRSNIL